MLFPKNKKFAFTIIDDTDFAGIENIRPVYEFLSKLGFRTTKTVWALPPKDKFKGASLENYRYRQFIGKLKRQGFEIALHNVSSGRLTRQDILDGLEIFRRYIGSYPKIQVNHAQNRDNIYWGVKRFSILKPFWRFSYFSGDNPDSAYFWGDYHQKHIKFTRNFTFKTLNTLARDPHMPYLDHQKSRFSNYWFSSSDAGNLAKFNRLLAPSNIDRLKKEGGAAIIYTHFASGFVKKNRLDGLFQKNLAYLAGQNGWYVTASELLEYLLTAGAGKPIKSRELLKLEFWWLWDKIRR